LSVRRGNWSAAAVTSSGVLYVLPYVVLSSGADFRYIWWLVVATLVGVVLLLFDMPAPQSQIFYRRMYAFTSSPSSLLNGGSTGTGATVGSDSKSSKMRR